MNSSDLDQLLNSALQTPDEGFTERVLGALPSEKQSFLQKWQWRLWLSTAGVVLGAAIAISRTADFSNLTNASFVAMLIVSVTVVWAHFEDLLIW